MAVLGPRPKFGSGTYEVNGNTVTLHTLVGKNEHIVETSSSVQFKIEGNTLIWTAPHKTTVLRLTRLE